MPVNPHGIDISLRSTTPDYPLGFEVTLPALAPGHPARGDEGPQVWVYVYNDSGSAIVAYQACVRKDSVAGTSIDGWAIREAAVSGTPEYTQRVVGFTQAALADGRYGFILKRGIGTVAADALAAADTPMVLSAATAGEVTAAAALTDHTIGYTLAVGAGNVAAYINCGECYDSVRPHGFDLTTQYAYSTTSDLSGRPPLGMEITEPAMGISHLTRPSYGERTWVFVYNDSGATIAYGHAASRKAATQECRVRKAPAGVAAINHPGIVVGVCQASAGLATGYCGWILKKGLGVVTCDATGITVNQGLIVDGSTDGCVTSTGAAAREGFGLSLAAVVGAGAGAAYIACKG